MPRPENASQREEENATPRRHPTGISVGMFPPSGTPVEGRFSKAALCDDNRMGTESVITSSVRGMRRSSQTNRTPKITR
jgi:hypothetical protein